MNKKIALNALWLLPLVLFTALSINSIAAQSAASPISGLAYPPPATPNSPVVYPPPSASPTPVTLPQKPSAEAQKALEYITKRDSIPAGALIIQDDHPTQYPSLGRKFQVVTLIDTRPKGQIYELLVDLANGKIEENISALMKAEDQAYQSHYGKLDPALYERLQKLGDNDAVTVAVWMAGGPQKTLSDLQATAFAALAAKYPEAKAAMQRSGKPMDVDDPKLARQIEAEYMSILSDEMKIRTQPLVTDLETRKYSVTTYDGMPSFSVVLPKSVILELSKREDVSAIYLAEGEAIPALDSAIPSALAPEVWGRGFEGNGVTIAILEHGNVNPIGSSLHLSSIKRNANNGIQPHTTHVACDAASFDSTYTGMAPQATILSAGENGNDQDIVDGLHWAIVDQNAPIVNISENFWGNPSQINWIDRAFDYLARFSGNGKTIVAASGDNHVHDGTIGSPGTGWNVLTVGAYDDHNTADWSDDTMWSDSSYVNPTSPNSDREKPEVVASGVSITAIVNYALDTSPGTSHTAPQVAGLAALLINRNYELQAWPEVLRAIIMASATHNIEGPTIIDRYHGDLRDGAGAINADEADKVAQVRGDSGSDCNSSCWWSDSISQSDTLFPVGSEKNMHTFNASTGTLVRVAIAWWANADTQANNYSFDRLDTNLDLKIYNPDGSLKAVSTSYDNNYEMVEFVAMQPGQYQIAIKKQWMDEFSNYLGTALVMIHRIYLPLMMK